MDPRRPAPWIAALVVLAGVATAIVKFWPQPGPAPIQPICLATTATGSYSLELDQAANATTIAVAAERLGLPDHAVTIGLAAALQESTLHNLDHGDRDSLGLFQQRPSQGWGTPAQVMEPTYAAVAFFRHLARIPGWDTMPVADAAQAVQHSAAPEAYADWEDQARVIASALTGEVAGGFACRYPTVDAGASVAAGRLAALTSQLTSELGHDPRAPASSEKNGWVVASWLIGHAQQYGLRSIIFAGERWTSSRLGWRPDPPSDLEIRTDPPM